MLSDVANFILCLFGRAFKLSLLQNLLLLCNNFLPCGWYFVIVLDFNHLDLDMLCFGKRLATVCLQYLQCFYKI